MRVTFPNGDQAIEAELALPRGPEARPGVVLIPDVGGLSALYESFAAKLAQEGFVALAINKYSRGERPDLSSLDATFKFLRELPDPQVLADVQAAIDHLAGRPEVGGRRIGLTGFCVGGQYTILAACSSRGLSAAVSWYGMLRVPQLNERNPEHPLDALARLGCPLLAHFGGEDAIVPQVDVAEFERRAAGLAHMVQTVVYPGAGHAFANPGRPDAFRPEAAEAAWRRTFAFLHEHLD